MSIVTLLPPPPPPTSTLSSSTTTTLSSASHNTFKTPSTPHRKHLNPPTSASASSSNTNTTKVSFPLPPINAHRLPQTQPRTQTSRAQAQTEAEVSQSLSSSNKHIVRLRPLGLSSAHNQSSPYPSSSSSSTTMSTKSEEFTVIHTSEEEDTTPNASKLKRLSLLARPSSLDLVHTSSALSTPISLNVSPSPGRTPTSAGSGRSSRPTPGRGGLRSSISYSPAPRSSRSSTPAQTPRGDRWSDDDIKLNHQDAYEAGVKDSGIGLGLGLGPALDPIGKTKRQGGQTLTEKHADLLTLIAQRERRVNELRQELQQQEASLAQLKSKWTTIVSRSAGVQAPGTDCSSILSASGSTGNSSTPCGVRLSGHARPRPRSIALSSSTSSASSLSLSTIDEPMSLSLPVPLTLGEGPTAVATAALTSLIHQTEGYLSPEVVEGGKKFLGNLWKTVGAAAGGTVPAASASRNEGGSERSDGAESSAGGDGEALEDWTRTGFSPKLDLANLQRMILPWNMSTSSAANASNQNREKNVSRNEAKSPSVAGPNTITSGNVATKNDHDIDLLSQEIGNIDSEARSSGLGKSLTPQRPKAKAQPSSVGEAEAKIPSEQTDGSANGEADEGWGW